jgi:hypothetical protein
VKALPEGLQAMLAARLDGAVLLGLGRIVALHYRSPTLYQMH